MKRIAPIGLLLLVSLAGCVHVKPPLSVARPSDAAPSPPAASPDRSVTSTPEVVQPPAAIPTQQAQPTERSVTTTPSKTSANRSPEKVTAPASSGAAKRSAPSAPREPAAQPPKQATVATISEKASAPASPTLDLASLQQRLRDTRSIGVFTKLSLKNQVDDLLGQFRAFYQQNKPPLPELRQRYDLLVIKVLAVLQDNDPSLASAISSSREAIWGILADPKKFAQI